MGVGQFVLLVALIGAVVLVVCFAYGRSLNARVLAAEHDAARARAERDAAQQDAARARAEADTHRRRAEAAETRAARRSAEEADRPAADDPAPIVLGDGPGVRARLRSESRLHVVTVDVRADRTAVPEGDLRVTVTIACTETAGVTSGDALVDDLAAYAAGKLVGRAWTTATANWKVTDPGPVGAGAGRADAIGTTLHDLLVRTPAARTSRAAGIPALVGDGVAELAAGLVRPPLDGVTSPAAGSVRIVGVVVGVATGRPVLALSCVTSPAGDTVTAWVAEALRDRTGLDRER